MKLGEFLINGGCFAAVGGFAGYLIGIISQRRKDDERIKELERAVAYFESKDEYTRRSSPKEDEMKNTKEDNREKRDQAKKQKERTQNIDYTKYYNNESEEDDGMDISEEEEWQIEFEKNKDLPPKIISAAEALDLPPWYEKEVLLFYLDDQFLTDEDNNVIEDPDLLLGDCLDSSGWFDDEDDDLLFVQSFSIGKIYQIQKIHGGYYDTIERDIRE